jgi:hypothetical protein
VEDILKCFLLLGVHLTMISISDTIVKCQGREKMGTISVQGKRPFFIQLRRLLTWREYSVIRCMPNKHTIEFVINFKDGCRHLDGYVKKTAATVQHELSPICRIFP